MGDVVSTKHEVQAQLGSVDMTVRPLTWSELLGKKGEK